MTTTKEQLEQEGYTDPRQLPDGRWIGLRRMYGTIGLFVGLDETGYTHRYCYELRRVLDAIHDNQDWDGTGDPPGLWIKEKGREERLNPRWLEEAREEMSTIPVDEP